MDGEAEVSTASNGEMAIRCVLGRDFRNEEKVVTPRQELSTAAVLTLAFIGLLALGFKVNVATSEAKYISAEDAKSLNGFAEFQKAQRLHFMASKAMDDVFGES